MALRHEKRFEALGYTLEKFVTWDIRKVNPMGGIFKYRASKDGHFVRGFMDAVEAGEWIEGEEVLADNVTMDPIYRGISDVLKAISEI